MFRRTQASAARVLIVLLFFTSPAFVAQQPNAPAATAIWGGQNGPPWPIHATVADQVPFTYQVLGTPNQGFVLVYTPAGLAPGAITTGFGIVDLDLSAGYSIFIDGLFGGPSMLGPGNTGPTGISTMTFTLPAGYLGPLGGMQTIVGDPASSIGFTLTAATELTALPQGVYVSATTGAAGNPGTPAFPLNTITAGFAAAIAHSPPWPVFVAVGTYNENLLLTTASFIAITGGLDPATWAPVPSTRSVVNVGIIPSEIHLSAGG